MNGNDREGLFNQELDHVRLSVISDKNDEALRQINQIRNRYGGYKGFSTGHLLDYYEGRALFARFNVESPDANTLDEVIELYERSLNLRPDFADAHFQLGSVYSIKASLLGLPSLSPDAIKNGLNLNELCLLHFVMARKYDTGYGLLVQDILASLVEERKKLLKLLGL